MLYGVPWGGLFYLLVLELVGVVAGIVLMVSSDDALFTTIGAVLLLGGGVLVIRCIRRILALPQEP